MTLARIRTFRSLLATLVLLLVAAPAALAQVSDEAAELLTCAAEALGPASETLSTMQDVGTITYFGPTGDPVAILDYASYVDFAGERLRLNLSVGGVLVAVQQVTPDGGFLYSPETGTVDLPASELERFREAFVTGSTGLRLAAERERASVVADAELAGVSGTLVELVTNGVEHAVLLGPDCRFLGERTSDPDLGEVISLGAADAPIDGWWLAMGGELYAQGTLFARVEIGEGSINDPIDDGVFERP